MCLGGKGLNRYQKVSKYGDVLDRWNGFGPKVLFRVDHVCDME